MSFRGKLLLAIVCVAAVTTIATMLPAQRALQAAQENAIHDRFREDVSLARRLDQERLSTVAARCRTLARSVRLVAAIQEGDTQLLYDNARDELREVLAKAPAGAAASTSLPRATFVRFVGPDAELVAPPLNAVEFGSLPQAPQPLVQALRAALASPHGLEHGWLSFGPSQTDLHRVVVAAIDDPVTLKRLGALVLGFDAAATLDAKDTDVTDQVTFGLLVGDDLHLDGLAPGDRQRLVAFLHAQAAVPAPVAARGEIPARGGHLPGRARSSADTLSEESRELRLDVDGVPHLLFLEPLAVSGAFEPTYRIGLYSLEAALAERSRLQRHAATRVALVISAGLLAGLVLAHGLSAPVRALTSAARRVRAGAFDVRVPVRSHGELGSLSAAFNEMAAGLEQKERYRRLLDVIADRDVVAELLAGRIALGGELREVSVLFCDIRGFSALAREIAPEMVVRLLNEHMTALTSVVHAHRGIVDKFVGDLLMGVFGAPRSHGDDAVHAVRCASAMLRERARLNRTSPYSVEIGIAVATGEVVAGCTGSVDRLSYTVLGTPVNLVARLCAIAGSGEVLLDQATRARLGANWTVEALAPVKLKGFEAPVSVYRLGPAQQGAVPGASA